MRPPKTLMQVLVACLILLGVMFTSGIVMLQAAAREVASRSPQQNSPSAGEMPLADPLTSKFLPMVIDPRLPVVRLANAYIGTDNGNPYSAFLPAKPMAYVARGYNDRDTKLPVNLHWAQTGPCGSTEIFSDTVDVDSGEWQYTLPSLSPECSGIYTATIEISYQGNTGPITSSRQANFVIGTESALLYSNYQGFDRCNLPTVDQMQTWWKESPYWVYNLYLGGISFHCNTSQLDFNWVNQVAEQGWTYILTWVGPQAPCSGYTYRLPNNEAAAYQQGRLEAEAAVEAAERLGFMGQKAIYYDVESYYGASTSCRNVTSAMLRGWTERLHELGHEAGSYGAGCTSYITDWAASVPGLDNVWIAHWTHTFYYGAATVMDASCVSNNLWPSRQRIKQYAGDHTETWDAVSLRIDSDVLDADVNILPITPTLPAATFPAESTNLTSALIESSAFITPQEGWVLRANRLLWTSDSGGNWRDISPLPPASGRILAVNFRTAQDSLVLVQPAGAGESSLQLLETSDGGASWLASDLPLGSPEALASISSADLQRLDSGRLWISIKMQSGSAFSIGRLFTLPDDGQTWEERSQPSGSPVRFIDDQHGWAVGSPGGDVLYATQDGGQSWQAQNILVEGVSASDQVYFDLPFFQDTERGTLPVTISGASGSRLAFYTTTDRGQNWQAGPAQMLPASSAASLRLEQSIHGAAFSQQALSSALTSGSLPEGVFQLGFVDTQHGWAVAQTGACYGQKLSFGSLAANPLVCTQETSLWQTRDGGISWQAISLP
jgi:photosystem II stability/assembly factor-like uncharacterized protein